MDVLAGSSQSWHCSLAANVVRWSAAVVLVLGGVSRGCSWMCALMWSYCLHSKHICSLVNLCVPGRGGRKKYIMSNCPRTEGSFFVSPSIAWLHFYFPTTAFMGLYAAGAPSDQGPSLLIWFALHPSCLCSLIQKEWALPINQKSIWEHNAGSDFCPGFKRTARNS